MPTIDENQVFTVIVEVEIDPGHQQTLIDTIANQVEHCIRYDSGFVSASLHTSDEGRRIDNYAQWCSRKAWTKSRESGDDDAAVVIIGAIKRYGAEQTQLELCRVA
jgi:quinol monooxygenase YgiN